MITSISNSRVKQVVQWQTRAKERRRDKVFVVEGTKMYLEAPEPWIREVYVAHGYLERLHVAVAGRLQDSENGQYRSGGVAAAGQRLQDSESGQDVDVQSQPVSTVADKLALTGYEEVSDEVFAKMSDTQTPQGILAVMSQPAYHLEQLLEQEAPLFVVLENLQDPGNLGTILRTGEGAGITGVIMSDTTVDIFNPKVIRSTMGSIYRVPFLYETELLKVLERFREFGVKTYAAHLRGEIYYNACSFKGGTAFLIGNEGNGLSEELAAAASSYIKIPMEGRVESLNAGVAAALLMYEAHRQRQ